MFPHTMRNLDDTSDEAVAVPPGARDAQSVCAGESKLVRRNHGVEYPVFHRYERRVNGFVGVSRRLT
jgi:hypothetical protein